MGKGQVCEWEFEVSERNWKCTILKEDCPNFGYVGLAIWVWTPWFK